MGKSKEKRCNKKCKKFYRNTDVPKGHPLRFQCMDKPAYPIKKDQKCIIL